MVNLKRRKWWKEEQRTDKAVVVLNSNISIITSTVSGLKLQLKGKDCQTRQVGNTHYMLLSRNDLQV